MDTDMLRNNNLSKDKARLIRDVLDFYLEIPKEKAVELRDQLNVYIGDDDDRKNYSDLTKILSGECSDNGSSQENRVSEDSGKSELLTGSTDTETVKGSCTRDGKTAAEHSVADTVNRTEQTEENSKTSETLCPSRDQVSGRVYTDADLEIPDERLIKKIPAGTDSGSQIQKTADTVISSRIRESCRSESSANLDVNHDSDSQSDLIRSDMEETAPGRFQLTEAPYDGDKSGRNDLSSKNSGEKLKDSSGFGIQQEQKAERKPEFQWKTDASATDADRRQNAPEAPQQFNLEFLTGKMLTGIFAAVLLTIGFILTARSIDFSFGPGSKFLSMLISSLALIIWGNWNAPDASSDRRTVKSIFCGTGFTLLYVTVSLGCFYFEIIPVSMWIPLVVTWSGALAWTAASRHHIFSLIAQIGIILSMPLSISAAGISCTEALISAFLAQLPLQIASYRKSDIRIALYNSGGMILLLLQFLTIHPPVLTLPEMAAGILFGASTLIAVASCGSKPESDDWVVKYSPYLVTLINSILVIDMLGLTCFTHGILHSITARAGVLFTDMAEVQSVISEQATVPDEIISARGAVCSVLAIVFYALLNFIESRKKRQTSLIRPVSISFLGAILLAASNTEYLLTHLRHIAVTGFEEFADSVSAFQANQFILLMPLAVIVHYAMARLQKSESDKILAGSLAVFFSFILCLQPLLHAPSGFVLVFIITALAALLYTQYRVLLTCCAREYSDLCMFLPILMGCAVPVAVAGNAGVNSAVGGSAAAVMCALYLYINRGTLKKQDETASSATALDQYVFAAWLPGLYAAGIISTELLPAKYCFTGLAAALLILLILTKIILKAPGKNNSVYQNYRIACSALISLFYVVYGNYDSCVQIQEEVFKDGSLPVWLTWCFHTLLLLAAAFSDFTYHIRNSFSRNAVIYYCTMLMLCTMLITTGIFESVRIDLFMLYPLAAAFCFIGISRKIGILKASSLVLYLAATAGIYILYYSGFSDSMRLLYSACIFISSTALIWLNRKVIDAKSQNLLTASLFLESCTGILTASEAARLFIPSGYYHTVLAAAVLLQFGLIRFMLGAPREGGDTYSFFRYTCVGLISAFYIKYGSYTDNVLLQHEVLKNSFLPDWSTWCCHTLLLYAGYFADLRYHLKNSISRNMIVYYSMLLLLFVMLVVTNLFESVVVDLFTLYPLAACLCLIGMNRKIGALKILSFIMYLLATVVIYGEYYSDFSYPVQTLFTTAIYLSAAALIRFNRIHYGDDAYPYAMAALITLFSFLYYDLDTPALLVIPAIAHAAVFAVSGCRVQAGSVLALSGILIGFVIGNNVPDGITLLPLAILIPSAAAALIAESGFSLRSRKKQRITEYPLVILPVQIFSSLTAVISVTAVIFLFGKNLCHHSTAPDVLSWTGAAAAVLLTAIVLKLKQKNGNSDEKSPDLSAPSLAMKYLSLYTFTSAAALIFGTVVHNSSPEQKTIELLSALFLLTMSAVGIPLMHRLRKTVIKLENESADPGTAQDPAYMKKSRAEALCSTVYTSVLGLITAGTLFLSESEYHEALWCLCCGIFCFYTVPLMFRNTMLLPLKYGYVCVKFYFVLALVCFAVFDISSTVFSMIAILGALIFIVAGVIKSNRYLRVAGLGAASVFICKLIVFDINYSNDLYKALSYVGAGIILLVICLIYSNMRKTGTDRIREN